MLSALASSPWTRVPLVAILVVAIQTGFVSELRLFDVSPDLVVLVSVTAGLVGGPSAGLLCGFLAGLLYDVSTGSPFGLWALTLCLAGYAAGLTKRESLRDNVPLQAAIAALISVVAVLFYAVAGTIFGATGYITFRLIPMAILVALVSVVLYRPARAVLRWALLAHERRPT